VSSPRLSAGKIHVFARHADRAKSGVLRTRISRRQEALVKKKDRREKAQKLRHGRSRLHGYFGFVNGERSFSLEDVLSASLPPAVLLSCSRRSATASETAQREHRRSRLNGFLASPSSPPPSPWLPHSSLPLFYSSSSVFFSSSLLPLDAQIYSTVTFRSRRVYGPCSRVPRYLILPR